MTNIEDLANKGKDLFSLPDTTLRLQELLYDESSSLTDIADVVSIDPALTSRLLKIANSALYNFASKVDTISRAVSIIGSDALFNLALANSAVDSFKNIDKNVIDVERFWRESVDCALVTKELGVQIQFRDRERLFVLGLLQNIGELICVQFAPEQARASAERDSGKLPWALQQEHFGFTYNQLSAQLLRRWQLPPELYNAIEFAHDPEKSSFVVDASLLNIGIRTAHAISDPDSLPLKELVSEQIMARLELDYDNINNAVQYANLEAINILHILSPSSSAIF
ncbi:MAG: HDOD domain-containing protein [Pseudomonadales bacterium]|nr:HDOD domain-containing protein [Pseudomonadales bacterium]